MCHKYSAIAFRALRRMTQTKRDECRRNEKTGARIAVEVGYATPAEKQMVRLMKCRLLVFGVALFLLEAAHGQGTQFLWSTGEALNGDQRRQVAEELLELAIEYDTTLPTLTPKEQVYVQEERINLERNAEGARATRFLNSTEYEISEARAHLDTLKSLLTMIDRQEFSSSTQEIRLWTGIAYHLLSPDLYRPSRDLRSGTWTPLVSRGEFHGRQILVKMVIEQL